MYRIPELHARRSPTCTPERKLFFAMYYQVPDAAFERAAKTWQDVVKHEEDFQISADVFLMCSLNTETDFKTWWSRIHSTARDGNYVVQCGHLLTHASKQKDGKDGLEFSQGEKNDGTLMRGEIAALEVLPWSESGFLILAGCNSGAAGSRGWTPAADFAKRQGVPTLGQAGYAYFSRKWDSYDESDASSTSICLWAYSRGKNATLGGGGRMSGKVFMP